MWLLVWVWVQYTVRDRTEFWVPLAQTFKRQNNSYFWRRLVRSVRWTMFPETGLHPCTSRTTCPQQNWELTFELKKYICITATLINLHWLPVKSHITYKILFLTHKSFSALGPQSDLLQLHTVLNATVLSHGPAFFPLLQPSYLWGQSLQCSPPPLELSPI